eukprot:COSAG06_NODE_13783_length_1220_cov_0.677074_1_plen_79_part_00
MITTGAASSAATTVLLGVPRENWRQRSSFVARGDEATTGKGTAHVRWRVGEHAEKFDPRGSPLERAPLQLVDVGGGEL